MTHDLTLRCSCGQLQGVLHAAGPQRGQRLRCYCRDCQTYAQHLGQADKVLDTHGGTGLFQTTPRGLEITQGKDQLACLRLSPKGPLRWYARCCNTPIGNTMASAQLPFVTLVHSIWPVDQTESLGHEENGVFVSHARGDKSQLLGHAGIPKRAALKVGISIIKARLLGQHKPSAFFTPAGEPTVTPYILSREERAAARALCD